MLREGRNWAKRATPIIAPLTGFFSLQDKWLLINHLSNDFWNTFLEGKLFEMQLTSTNLPNTRDSPRASVTKLIRESGTCKKRGRTDGDQSCHLVLVLEKLVKQDPIRANEREV